MRMYISLGIAVLGAMLLLSPETLIDKNTSNTHMKMIYDNSMIVGMGALVVAYYVYSSKPEQQKVPARATEATTEMSEVPSNE